MTGRLHSVSHPMFPVFPFIDHELDLLTKSITYSKEIETQQ